MTDNLDTSNQLRKSLLKDEGDLKDNEKIERCDTPEVKLKKIFRTISRKTLIYKELMVSEKNGPFRTISAALRAVEGPTIILVESGLYNERIRIRKPDVKIMPSNASNISDVIILNSYSSSIEVDIPQGAKCEIINLKITHTAKNDEMEEKQKEKKKLVSAFMGMKGEFLNFDEDDPRSWKSGTIGVSDDTPSLVRVKSGSLIMKVTAIELKY